MIDFCSMSIPYCSRLQTFINYRHSLTIVASNNLRIMIALNLFKFVDFLKKKKSILALKILKVSETFNSGIITKKLQFFSSYPVQRNSSLTIT